MRLRHTLVAAVLAGAAFAGMGAYSFRWRVGAEIADGYSSRLRRLVAANHQLSGEVMRVRSGLVAHYDGVTLTATELRRLHGELGEPPRFLRETERAQVKEKLALSVQGFEEAARSVEQFKSEYAVLKNSLRFLPEEARRLDEQKAAAASPEQLAVSNLAEGVVRDLLLLQVWHDPRVHERVVRSLETLASPPSSGASGAAAPAAAAPGQPDPAAARRLSLLIAHARVVRDYGPSVDALTRTVALGPGALRAEQLTATYAQHYQRALDRDALHRTVTFGLALLTLAAAAAHVILRLRSSAEGLSRASRNLEEALASLRAEQEKQRELNDLKTRFVSMTSHEFRTPLSVMLSSAEMLSVYGDTWAPERREDHLGRIRAGAISMTAMLDSILLIGRSDAGMLELRPAPIRLDELCRDLVERAGQSTGQGGRIVYAPPPADTVVVADEGLLRHILENLLSNALKYSPAEKQVRFDVACDDQGVSFEVRDEGIGIPEEDQRQLFETFHRGRNVGRVAGTGLGLSIVKRAAERHGGTITIQSRVGEGTHCKVRIPCERVQSERRAS